MNAEIFSQPTAAYRSRPQPWLRGKPNERAWSINVLLVEDDPADTSLILNVLKRHPSIASVAATATPDLALSRLAEGQPRPDLILLDINMPRMDGFTFLEHLRRIPATRKTPVVFLTTSCLGKDVVEARHSSASLYVVKPDTYAELRTRLDVVIERATSGNWRK